MAEHFGDRLMDRVATRQSQVVVGLDPRLELMPTEVFAGRDRPADISPRAAAHAIRNFNRAVIDAVADHAVAVKPQVAFYERFGVEGMRAYASTIRYAREKDILVIADVKRNDIGSTARAYADAHLGPVDEEPTADDFVADAVTVNAYLGGDGVEPFLSAGARNGGGVFALVKTSNPSSGEIQDAICEGVPLHERMAALVNRWGAQHRGRSGYSLLGAVVGATYPEKLARLRELMPDAPLLVPGYGAQGGGVEDVLAAFHEGGLGAVVNSSRGVIFAWTRQPYSDEYGPSRWREAVWAAAADMRRELWEATH